MRATSITTTGLYVEPSTFCPLDCALCYTAHTTQRLLPAEVIHRAAALMLEDHHTLGIFWCGLGAVFQEGIHFGCCAIVHGYGEAVVGHVEDEVLAHDGQADESDIR